MAEKTISKEYLDAVIAYACMWKVETRIGVIDTLIELADNQFAVDVLINWHHVRQAHLDSNATSTRSYISTLVNDGNRDEWLLDESYYEQEEAAYSTVLEDLVLIPSCDRRDVEVEAEQCSE